MIQSAAHYLARSVLPSPLLGRIRSWRMRRHIETFPVYEVTHNYGGHDFSIRIGDGLAKGWYDHDWQMPSEIAFLKQRGSLAGRRIFDIGAHQGIVALMLAREAANVIAVEANAHNAAMCCANVERNGAINIAVVKAAISDSPGTLIFNQGLNGNVDDGAKSFGTCEVEAVTIDGLAKRFGHPDVLVIDVEGYECQALRGASITLAQHPICIIETHIGCGLEKFGSLRDLATYFSADFDLFSVEDDAPAVPTTRERIETAKERFQLIAIPR